MSPTAAMLTLFYDPKHATPGSAARASGVKDRRSFAASLAGKRFRDLLSPSSRNEEDEREGRCFEERFVRSLENC